MDGQHVLKKRRKGVTAEEAERVSVEGVSPFTCICTQACCSPPLCSQAAQLEALLFGTGPRFDEDEQTAGGSGAGYLDSLLAVEDGRVGWADAEAGDQEPALRRPAWEDEDAAELQVNVAAVPRLRKLRQTEEEAVLSGAAYEQRLRAQHGKLHPRTEWASLTSAKQRRKTARQQQQQQRQAGEESEEEEEGGAADVLLRTAGGLLASRGGGVLPPGMLETTRLRDANQAEPNASVVRSLEFHPAGQLLMTGGLDKRLRFFTVDGVKNAKVQSVFLEDMPVHCAAFCGGGQQVRRSERGDLARSRSDQACAERPMVAAGPRMPPSRLLYCSILAPAPPIPSQVLVTGRRRFFYVFDLGAGRIERVAGLFGREDRSLESFATAPGSDAAAFLLNNGHVGLVSLHSRQVVGTLKQAGSVRSAAFSPDGTELLTSGGDGTVHVWDLRMQRCRARLADEGCLNGTALAASPDGALFAAGSSSGVVNVYSREGLAGQGSGGGRSWATPAVPMAARPLKTLLHLTTAVDSLAFNHDGQILALASRLKRDALRLLHVPTMTVFANWPTSKSPLHYVHTVAFSPSSGYLAIGNARGRALLYRLHAFPTV